jgi:hypothetical protein
MLTGPICTGAAGRWRKASMGGKCSSSSSSPHGSRTSAISSGIPRSGCLRAIPFFRPGRRRQSRRSAMRSARAAWRRRWMRRHGISEKRNSSGATGSKGRWGCGWAAKWPRRSGNSSRGGAGSSGTFAPAADSMSSRRSIPRIRWRRSGFWTRVSMAVPAYCWTIAFRPVLADS